MSSDSSTAAAPFPHPEPNVERSDARHARAGGWTDWSAGPVLSPRGVSRRCAGAGWSMVADADADPGRARSFRTRLCDRSTATTKAWTRSATGVQLCPHWRGRWRVLPGRVRRSTPPLSRQNQASTRSMRPPRSGTQLGLGTPPDSRPLYVGKAEDSLVARDLRQHFTDGRTGSSTLRRSIAALLHDSMGLRGIPRNPQKPGYFSNYGLSPAGRRAC